MATLDDLVESEHLHKVEDVLDPHEQEERLLYMLPRAKIWMETKLTEIEADGFYENMPTPSQQADDLFYAFISGDQSLGEWEPHPMRPDDQGVWELRTADLRFFGWFWRRGIFIISAVNQAEACKDHGLYTGYLEQCRRDRAVANLPPRRSSMEH